MALLIGRVYHQVDEKNRIRIPAKFKALFPKGETLYFFRRNKNRIAIFPESLLSKVLGVIENTQPTDAGEECDAVSVMSGFIEEVVFDGQGRTQLPGWARSEAHITKDVVTLGLKNFIELWDQATYENLISSMSVGAVNGLVYNKKGSETENHSEK